MMAVLLRPRRVALVTLLFFAWLGWAVQMPAAAPSVSPGTPETLGLWTGASVEAVQLEGGLERDQVTFMEYQLGTEASVWLTRVDGLGDRATFHPPELCLTGSSLTILDRTPITVFTPGRTDRVMRLLVSDDGQPYETWYWFAADGRITPSYYRQQLRLLAGIIRGQPASGALVRITTPLTDGSEAARRRLLAFFTAYQETAPRSRLRVARR